LAAKRRGVQGASVYAIEYAARHRRSAAGEKNSYSRVVSVSEPACVGVLTSDADAGTRERMRVLQSGVRSQMQCRHISSKDPSPKATLRDCSPWHSTQLRSKIARTSL
jgi:hypothetical protein